MKPFKHSKLSVLSALVTCGVLLSPCSASAITINAQQDTTIYDNGNANGAGQGLFTGTSGNGTVQRALIEFDLSSIAIGSTITNVTLTMHVNAVGSANTTDTITLNSISQSWNAGTASTGGTVKGGGSGTTPNTGDATWTSSGSSPWVAGGAFDSTVSDSLLIGNTGFHTFSGAGLITDIQYWIDNPDSNFGWILRGDETTTSSSKRFSSSENTGGSGANVPVLNIEYQLATVPVPAAVWLFGSGLITLFGVARSKA